jgi:hypothetical protein
MNDLPSQASQEEVIKRYDIPNTDVWVRQEHCIDSMGPYSDGTYEFYYEYDMYYFTSENYFVHARSYIDTPNEASFRGLEVNGENRFLTKHDFQLPFMQTAIEYLLSVGKEKLKWLDTNNQNGYSTVPLKK